MANSTQSSMEIAAELGVDLELRLPGPVKRAAARTITGTASQRLHGLCQLLRAGDAR